MRGGARSRSGPAPSANALRRDRSDDREWLVLPAGKRGKRSPKNPLPEPDELFVDREKELWNELWKKPQAFAWDFYGMEYQVAIYCRRAVESEVSGSSPGLSQLVKQLGEQLGLTPQAMNALRWKLEAEPESTAPATEATPTRASVKDRLKVVGNERGA